MGVELKWPIHEKKLFIIASSLKAWHHYLGFHKTNVFTNNVSLKYFENQPKATTKQVESHDTLALMDIELIHKLGKKSSVRCIKLQKGIPRGNALGEYSNFPIHVCGRKQSRKKDMKNVRGRSLGAKLF